jgi:DNA-binding NtrC family response regulator
VGNTPKTTLRAIPKPNVSRLNLLVLGDGAFATHALPDHGEVLIGRGEGCDIVIDDDSISRKHATLRLDERIMIEDLGSANGTRVRESWLASGDPVEIAPGEVVEIGSLMLILQDRTPRVVRPRRLWDREEFEARLDEECRRAERSGASFAIGKIECAEDAPDDEVARLLGELVRSADVIGRYGEDDYAVLLVDCSVEEAPLFERRIHNGLADAGVRARVATAIHGRDGRNAETLVARATARARGESETSAVTSAADAAMQQLHRLVTRVATGTISVLILGETGVGKEVLAERIHRLSPRAQKPFLRLNCAALSESLLESELFGYERGAFTGANTAKQGLLETAHTGTVFLDEIGELPLATQVKLLRVLEAREVMRVGALKSQPIDVRFVSATNRDLEAEVTRGAFRQDLYFRLNGVALLIPPLRQRAGEIAGLARTFVAQFCAHSGHLVPDITAAAMGVLERYDWPGNIRELRNVIERATLLAADGLIDIDQLPIDKMHATNRQLRMRAATTQPPVAEDPPAFENGSGVGTLGSEIEELERARILEALDKCAGNQTRAAQMLGISRRTLTNRMNEFNLPRPRKK